MIWQQALLKTNKCEFAMHLFKITEDNQNSALKLNHRNICAPEVLQPHYVFFLCTRDNLALVI